MMKYLMFVVALLASAWMLRAWLLRQQRAAIVTGRPSPQAPAAGLHPREVRLIRRRAEHAAWRVAHGELQHARNPFPAGTRQHVLWTSSFHASGVALGGGTRPPHVGARGEKPRGLPAHPGRLPTPPAPLPLPDRRRVGRPPAASRPPFGLLQLVANLS